MASMSVYWLWLLMECIFIELSMFPTIDSQCLVDLESLENQLLLEFIYIPAINFDKKKFDEVLSISCFSFLLCSKMNQFRAFIICYILSVSNGLSEVCVSVIL